MTPKSAQSLPQSGRVWSSTRARTASKQRDGTLLFLADLFRDDAVRGILDDWLVPILVDEFIRDYSVLPDPAQLEHNENRP